MCISTFIWTSMCVFAYWRTYVYKEMCMGVGMCMVCIYVWSCNWIRPKFVCDAEKVQVQKSTVTRGLPSLIEYCRLRRNWALHSYLIQQNSSSPPGIVHVHPQYRRSFVDPKRLKALDEQPHTPSSKQQKLRSANDEFQWKVNCFLCG